MKEASSIQRRVARIPSSMMGAYINDVITAKEDINTYVVIDVKEGVNTMLYLLCMKGVIPCCKVCLGHSTMY